MRLSHFFMSTFASALLNARLHADCSNRKSFRKTSVTSRYLRTYPQIVNFLLEKYGMDEIIAETVSAITRFAQPAGLKPLKYSEKLVAKTLRSGDVCKEYALNKTFVEGLDSSM